ncbi:MAG: hypothetical protein WCJ84_06140 [Candidatus Peregrinibacteria bacterium]
MQVKIGAEQKLLTEALEDPIKKGESFAIVDTFVTDYFGDEGVRVRSIRLMMAERAGTEGDQPLFTPVSVTNIDPLLKPAQEPLTGLIDQQNTVFPLMTGKGGNIKIGNEKISSIGRFMVEEALGRSLTVPQDLQNISPAEKIAMRNERKMAFQVMEMSAFFLQTDPNKMPKDISFFPFLKGLGENGIINLYSQYVTKRQEKNGGEVLPIKAGNSMYSVVKDLMIAVLPPESQKSEDAFQRFFSASEPFLQRIIKLMAKGNPFTPFGEWAQKAPQGNFWGQQFEWDQNLFLSADIKKAMNDGIAPVWENFSKSYASLGENLVNPHKDFPFKKEEVLSYAHGDAFVANGILSIFHVERGILGNQSEDMQNRLLLKKGLSLLGKDLNSYGMLQINKQVGLEHLEEFLQYTKDFPDVFKNESSFGELQLAHQQWEQGGKTSEDEKNMEKALITALSESHSVNLFMGIVILQSAKERSSDICHQLGTPPLQNPDIAFQIMLDTYSRGAQKARETWDTNRLMTIMEKIGMPPENLQLLALRVKAKEEEIVQQKKDSAGFEDGIKGVPFPELSITKETFFILSNRLIQFLQQKPANHPLVIAIENAFPNKKIGDILNKLQAEIQSGNQQKKNMLAQDEKGKFSSPYYKKIMEVLQKNTRASLTDTRAMEYFTPISRYSHLVQEKSQVGMGILQNFPQNSRNAVSQKNVTPIPILNNIPDISPKPGETLNKGDFLQKMGASYTPSLQGSLLQLSGELNLSPYTDYESENSHCFQKILSSKTSKEEAFFAMEKHIAIGKRFFMEWKGSSGKRESVVGIFTQNKEGELSVQFVKGRGGEAPREMTFGNFLTEVHAGKRKNSSLRVTIVEPQQ